MRDAETPERRAVLAFEAAWDGNPEERDAQLDALDADHIHSLVETCDSLRLAARKLWIERTRRPTWVRPPHPTCIAVTTADQDLPQFVCGPECPKL